MVAAFFRRCLMVAMLAATASMPAAAQTSGGIAPQPEVGQIPAMASPNAAGVQMLQVRVPPPPPAMPSPTAAPAAPAATLPAGTLGEQLQKADALRQEGSFRLARELYDKILAPEAKADPETKTHAQVFQLDCAWRERSGDGMQRAPKELARLVEDLPGDSRWRAEAAESLGDLLNEMGRWAGKHESLEYWLIALKYWGEAPEVDLARPRYVAINFKIAENAMNRYGGVISYPATPEIQALGLLPPPPPANMPWQGDLASWALRNVLRVSQDPIHKAHAMLMLGEERMNFRPQNWGPLNTKRDKDLAARWEKEGEDYLKQAAAITPVNPFTDRAWWDLAQYYEQRQRYVDAARTVAELLKRFSKSETQYFDQAQEMEKRLTHPQAGVSTGEVYNPDSYIRVQLDYRNINRATLRIFKVNPDLLIEGQKLDNVEAMLKALSGEKVKEQALEGITDEKKYIPHNKVIFLEPLPAGVYVVAVDAPGQVEPGQPRRCVFRVSRLAVIGRNAGENEAAFAADAESGKPLPGVKITALYKFQRGPEIRWETRRGQTDASGVARLERPVLPDDFYRQQVFFYAAQGDQFASAIAWGGNMGRRQQGQEENLFIYATSDRPAYRPGEPILWKAILRATDGKTYKLPSREKVYLVIRDGRGQTATEGEFTLSEFGSINGSFTLDRKAALGMLNMEIWSQKNDRVLARAGLARLEEYKLPEYKVSVDAPTTQTQFGAAQTFNIGAEFYSGGPVPNADVEVVVYRKAFWPSWRPPHPFPWYYENEEQWGRKSWLPWHWPGWEPENVVLTKSLKTDAQGKAKVELAALSPEDIKQAKDRGIWGYDYRVEARVVDASRREVRESGSVKTARSAFAAYLTPRCYLYLPGDPIKIDLRTMDPNDRPVAAEGFVTMYKHTWNEKHVDDQGRVRPDYDDTRLVVRPGYTAAKEGTGLVEFSPSEPGCYLFRFESKDQFGEDVKAETIVFVAGNDTHNVGFRSGGVTIITDKDTYQRGDTAHVLLSVRRQGAAVWFGVESEGVNALRVVPIEGTVKMIDVPVTADMEPNVFFTAAAMFDYEAFQDQARIVVPPTRQFLDVKLTSPKPVYKPGEKARIEVEIKDAEGKPVATEISLGAADAAVWAIQGDLAEDIRQAFWSHMRNLSLFSLAASPGQQQTQRWRPKEDNPEEIIQVYYGYEEKMKEAENDEASQVSATSGEFEGRGARRGGLGGAGGGFAMDQFNGPVGGVNRQEMFFAGKANAAMLAPAAAPMRMMKSMADKDNFLSLSEAEAKVPGQAMQEARVRSNFSSTAIWLPAIVTDEGGHASAEVTFPDSLTTWKLTARAADKATRVGQVRNEVKTNKPVLVRPEGPRFFTQGDAVTLSAIVNNNTSDTLPVEVSLDLAGLKLTRFDTRETASGAGADKVSTEPVPSNDVKIRILVPGQGQRRVDWRAVAEIPGEARIKTTALTTVDSDAVERTFPVFEYGIEQFIAAGATIKGTSGTQEKTMTLNVPEARRPGSEGLTIWIEPTLARTMVGALDYLAQYPYGCVEQTMSRFVPAVITAKTLQQLGLHKPELEKTLPDMIKAGLDRLEDFQHTDGGWGWWKEGESDLYMTAYVVQGLAQALAADAPVKRETLDRAVNYLQQNLIKAQDQVDLSAFMLYALASARPAPAGAQTPPAEAGSIPPAYDRVWAAREKLNAYTRALFTLACKTSGRAEWATTLARNMRNGLIEDKGNGTAHWGTHGLFYHWSDGGVESTAFSLRALLAAEPGSDLQDPAMTWLVRNRKGNRWENTKDTAITISALADYIKAVKEDKPDWTAEVEVNGEVVATLRAEPGKVFEFEGKIEVPASKLRTGQNRIVIRRRGSGVLYASAWLTYFTREAEIKPAGNEVFAERKYFRTALKPTLSGIYTTVREEVKPGTVLKSGDRIDVELSIEAKNNYEYVVIEDLKAAGMEPTEVKSGDVWGGSLSAHRELRDEKTAFFVTRLPEGKHLLKYELRAEVPGVFNALPTLVHAMYVPEIRANSAGAKIEIKD